jgi:hypothetical protein
MTSSPDQRTANRVYFSPVDIGIYLDLRNPPSWPRPWTEHYRTWLRRVTLADQLGWGMAGVPDIIVADVPQATMPLLLPHLARHLNSCRAAMVAGTDRPAPRVLSADDLAATESAPGRVRGLVVLTPEDTIAEIRSRVDGLPVRHVFFWASIAGMPDDVVDRHVELLATEVASALRSSVTNALP